MIIDNEPAFKSYCALNKINMRLFYQKTAGKSIFRFWKEKPRVFPMDREKDVLRILRYIHNNPVKRGLVECPEEWEHSSCRYYQFGERCRIEVGMD
jgi:REP element-mobilizing transposase RayT